MGKKNTDLHVHSCYSDGDLSPADVVKRAKKAGIKNLALADHNSIDGVEEAVAQSKKQGINVIPAIEIRAEEDEVLGYFVDYKNEELKKEVLKIQRNLIERLQKIIVKLNEKGIEVNFEDLLKEYKPNKNFMEIHLIKYLKSRGLGSIRELWEKFIADGSETYVPVKEISVLNSIKLIKKYGGVPVLAHPWVEPKTKELLKEENFDKLVKAGLKGIEIDNGDRDERRDEQTLDKIKRLADKYNLVVTSGSDFHGDYLSTATKSHVLGEHNCDEEVVEQLRRLADRKT